MTTTVRFLAGLLAVTAIDIACAKSLGRGNRKTATADYSDRGGYPNGISSARGGPPRISCCRRT